MAESRVERLRRWLTRGSFTPVAVMCGLVVVFLWKPLTNGGYYTPADVLNGPLFGHLAKPRNYLLSDVAVGYNPFLAWSRSQIRSGHLPLWNPYNGAGAPVIGNGSSAVLSVFSLPTSPSRFVLRWSLPRS